MTVHSDIDRASIDRGTPERAATQSVTLEIDGMPVTVPAGTSIMRAASLAGIHVPKLCATDSAGAVRLVPAVPGRDRRAQGNAASCTTAGRERHEGFDQNDRLAKLRRGVMELYISDHPLDCLTCAANGDCELQDMAGRGGLARGALWL